MSRPHALVCPHCVELRQREEARIVAAYVAKEPIATIARRHEISTSKVCEIARAHGAPYRIDHVKQSQARRRVG